MGPPLNLFLSLLDLIITGVLLLPWLLVCLVNVAVVYIKHVGIEGHGIQHRYDLLNIAFWAFKKIK